MIKEEILCSDVLYLGSRVVSASEFRAEFPEWYQNWKKSHGKTTLSDYVLLYDYTYGVSATLNAVYSVDFENATAEYLSSFENEKNEGGLYHPPIRIGNGLLFAPCNAHSWAYYDLGTNEWSYESIPQEYICGEGPVINASVWPQTGNQMIYMPGSATVVISVDFKTGEISYHDCLKTIRKKDGTLPKFASIVAYGDSVLLFTSEGNEVYEIDTKTMQLANIHRIPIRCKGIFAATSVPETDWIFILEHPQTSRVIKWDVRRGVTEIISDLPIGLDANSTPGPILGFCYDYSGLYIIPQQDNCIVKIDYCENKATRIDLHSEINLLERKDAFYHRWGYGIIFGVIGYNGYKNTSTVVLPYDFSIAEIDFENGVFLNKRKWKVSGIENLIRKSMKHQVDGIYMENDYFGLKAFMDDINTK